MENIFTDGENGRFWLAFSNPADNDITIYTQHILFLDPVFLRGHYGKLLTYAASRGLLLALIGVIAPWRGL